MAGKLYEGIEVDNAKDQVRILRLLPKSAPKHIKADVQIVKAQDVPESGSQYKFFASMETKIQELAHQSLEKLN